MIRIGNILTSNTPIVNGAIQLGATTPLRIDAGITRSIKIIMGTTNNLQPNTTSNLMINDVKTLYMKSSDNTSKGYEANNNANLDVMTFKTIND